MAQTPATKLALERDKYRCQWCYYKNSIRRGVFDFVPNYPMMGGGHHIFKRGRVDAPDAIIALCSECHYKAEQHTISKHDLISLMEFKLGVQICLKYRQFHDYDIVTPWAEIARY